MSSIEVIFEYIGQKYIIQSEKNEKMRNIVEKFITKSEANLDTINFLYSGNIINLDKTFDELANNQDKERGKMNILVMNNYTCIINQNNINSKVKSKEIICSYCNCFENCRISINDYKIILYECKNGHKTNNILLDEFNNTQMINESNIICSDCCTNNKSNSYNKQFYKCLTCEQNLCLLCNQKHNKNHKIIDYDQKYYFCKMHNDTYISYCKNCKSNLCLFCISEHNEEHEIIEYKSIVPDKNKIKEELNELRKNIDLINENINDVIYKLQNLKQKMEAFYQINNDIYENYNIQKKSYQNFKNINDISEFIKIFNLNKIVNNNKIADKISNLLDIFDKMVTKNDNHDIFIKKEIEKKHQKEFKKKLQPKPSLNKEEKNKIQRKNTKQLTENKSNDKIKDTNSKEIKIRKSVNEINLNKNEKKIFNKETKNDKPIEIHRKSIKPINSNEKIIHQKSIRSFECDEKNLNNEIIINYKVQEDSQSLKIFGRKFVENNKSNCTIIFDENKTIKLSETIDIPQYYKSKDFIEIKLKGIDMTDMSYMFSDCISLISINKKSKWNTSNITDMKNMFSGCKNLTSLSNISKWDTTNVIDMSCMFKGCISLSSLPDLSKWNTMNVKYMNSMFEDCVSLTSLHGISSWKISNVINMNDMFSSCSSLKTLPDISKWDTSKVKDMSRMFNLCVSLTTLPNISEWDISNLEYKYGMFSGFSNSIVIPSKFK